jgi:hypothetical protein
MRPYQNCLYIAPEWANKFAAANLADFTRLWAAELSWVEEPNYRRGGWSGVSRHQLDPNDPNSVVYIKRQQDHIFRPWSHPKRGLPTFYREMRNILHFQKHGIPVVTPLFFDMRKQDGKQQAILVTQALIGYESLEELLVKWKVQGFPNVATCKAIVYKIATSLRKIHDLGYKHGCYKDKHIFLRYDETLETADIRLLDFEVTRKIRYKRKRVMPDMINIYFGFRHLPARYYYYFLKYYLQVDKVTSKEFGFVRAIRRFNRNKLRNRAIKDFILRRDRARDKRA